MNYLINSFGNKIIACLFGKRTLERDTFGAALLVYLVSSCITILGGIIDGVIIGMYGGVDSWAAFGLANPLFFSFALFGSIFYAGSRPFCMRILGKGQVEQTRGLFSKSLIIC